MPPSPTDRALTLLARVATRKVNHEKGLQGPAALTLTPATQRDSALLPGAAVVHPLERLDTAYQGIVLEAARGVDDDELAQSIESETLSHFCFMDVQPLRLLGVPAGQPYANVQLPLMSDLLQAAKRQLKAAEAEIGQPAVDAATRQRAQRRALAAHRLLDEARIRYRPAGGWPQAPVLPLLQQAQAALRAARLALQAAQGAGVANACAELRKALLALTEMQETGAAVQMFHNIASFYLFRLLVRFRAEADSPIGNDRRADCSGELTKQLNNVTPWVAPFLRQRIAALDVALQQEDPAGNVLFFLKGGRALALWLGPPANGENDWDTQVVINPTLAAADWYAVFERIHNRLLLELARIKREFAVELATQADAMQHLFQAALEQPLPPPPLPAAAQALDDAGPRGQPGPRPHEEMPEDEDEDPPPLRQRAGCKAELIDIGMPRRESVEAIEQWALLAGKLQHTGDGVPIPGVRYYVNEYLMLVREGMKPNSRAGGKLTKRALRLYQVLNAQPQQLPQSVGALMPLCAAALPQLVPAVAASAHAAVLTQFFEAYDLALETGLAAQVDSDYLARLAEATQGRNASNFAAACDDVFQELTPALRNDVTLTGMLRALAFATVYSRRLQDHLRDRAAYLTTRRDAWLAFVQAFTGSSVFAPPGEVRAALSGSLAGILHAEAGAFEPMTDLAPLWRVELSVLNRSPDVDLPTLWSLLQPVVQQSQLASGLIGVTPGLPAERELLLRADQPVALGVFTYAPVEGRITLEPPLVGFPSLAAAAGTLLLPLPDLVRQYRRWAGHTEELGMAQLYRRMLGALSALTTRFENPEPMGYAVAELRRGRVHHLQLSSDDNANGPAANYPPRYYPDRAFTVTLGSNPRQLRQQLTMPRNPDVDRSIDLLVVNQGHGGVGLFTRHWNADALRDNVVRPLQEAGVTVQHLVLDFCLSASLIPVFAPLCAPGGHIYGAMYSTTAILMDSDTWRGLWPLLQGRRVDEIGEQLLARAWRLSAQTTGGSHLERIRGNQLGEDQVRAWLLVNGNDRDAISIIRYLPQIRDALFSQPPQQGLLALVALSGNPNLGDSERALLRPLGQGGQVAVNQLDEVRALFRQRLIDILTLPRYLVEQPAAALQPLPTWAANGDSLWLLVLQQRDLLLSLASGLRRCPSVFAVFDRSNRRLRLDAALLALQPGSEVWDLLATVDLESPDDVLRVLRYLQADGSIQGYDGQVDFLQP